MLPIRTMAPETMAPNPSGQPPQGTGQPQPQPVPMLENSHSSPTAPLLLHGSDAHQATNTDAHATHVDNNVVDGIVVGNHTDQAEHQNEEAPSVHASIDNRIDLAANEANTAHTPPAVANAGSASPNAPGANLSPAGAIAAAAILAVVPDQQSEDAGSADAAPGVSPNGHQDHNPPPPVEDAPVEDALAEDDPAEDDTTVVANIVPQNLLIQPVVHQNPPPSHPVTPPPPQPSPENDTLFDMQSKTMRRTVVCVVCGGLLKPTDLPDEFPMIPDWMKPILVRPNRAHPQWPSKCTDQRNPRCSADVMQTIEPTAFHGGPIMDLNDGFLSINSKDALMYIPIHSPCFKMAQIFCAGQANFEPEYHSAAGGAPGNILQLYDTWRMRAAATCPNGLMTRPILEASSMYSGPPVFDKVFHTYLPYELDRYTVIFTADPINIPGITGNIISRLETMDGKSTAVHEDVSSVWAKLNTMPPEIVQRVLSHLELLDSDNGPSLVPTRCLPQRWWKERLMSGKLIPWLFDLDEREVVQYRIEHFYTDCKADVDRHKQNGEYIFDEEMWDWELLCRKLAQPMAFKRGGLLYTETVSLCNRNRIWKLLDSARRGNVLFDYPVDYPEGAHT